MKILLVHNSYQQPGGEDVTFEQELQLLRRAGHDVVTYLRSNSEVEGYSVLKKLALAKDVVWASGTRSEFARLLLQEKPQLVHIHNTFFVASPSIYSACLEARIPVVQTLHNYRLLCPAATFFRDGRVCTECVDDSLWQGVRHGCYRDSRAATATVAVMLATHRRRGTWTQMVDSYIALTNFARQLFVRGGLPAEKIMVKPHFVYPDPGARSGPGEYALFVGRLSPEKGAGMLLDAWEQLRNPIPLRIVGDGPLRSELEARVAQRSLAGVSFTGHLDRSQVFSAMKGARFVLVPSECYENFPTTICEAFSCGAPVICSRMGAMEELVRHGRTGLYFEPGNSDDLAAKVEWAWEHPLEMELMGREARNEYLTNYGSERNYEKLMEIYHQAIARSGSSLVDVEERDAQTTLPR
jgi:glycosyltransferase involved in cell wall biosynthesis